MEQNLKLSVKGDGSFEQEIRPNVNYIVLATCQGYLNHKEELKVDPVTVSKEYTLQFPLASIRVPVLIDNIFYDFDKATLRPESEAASDKLVKLLEEKPRTLLLSFQPTQTIKVRQTIISDYRNVVQMRWLLIL